MPFIEIPDFDKLPKTLMGGTFTLGHTTDQMAYYLFHDKTWAADHRHMLGWAREAKHSLETLQPAQAPDWLFGHGFHKAPKTSSPQVKPKISFKWPANDRMENVNIVPVYELSGGTDLFNKPKVIFMCDEAIRDLEVAGITIDQWGCDDTSKWTENLLNHIDTSHPIAAAALKVLTPLQFHVARTNHANSIHHPSYPVKPNG